MRRFGISVTRGGVAALLAAGTMRSANGQVPAAPVRVVKDTLVVRIDGVRIPLDSLRVLLRAFDGEPLSSMQSEKMRRELDAMAIASKVAAGIMGRGLVVADPDGFRPFGGFPAKGWIGLTTAGMHHDVERADAHFVQYLDYPPIVSVERRSPAQLAGILPGDTLVAYDGVDVVAHPVNLTQLLTPEKRIGVTVRRDGENKAFALVVSRMPNAVFTRRVFPGDIPGFPFADDSTSRVFVTPGGTKRIELRGGPGIGGGIFMLATPNGVFGASMSEVGAELAKAFRIEPGVLVNEVPNETPAFRMGLKAGDVIVSVAGQTVTSVDDVRKLAMLRGESRSVTLQIVRDRKTRSIIVP